MKMLVAFFCLLTCTALCQDDLLKELEDDEQLDKEKVFATFKGTRIVNGHSIETTPGGALEFIFSHRFGRMNTGWYEMFGLDQAYVRIGLDYGISDRFSASFGRNSINKTLDTFVKYKLVEQQSGTRTIPVTITALGGAALWLERRPNRDVYPKFSSIDRLSYTGQMLIASKLSTAVSFQLSPTIIHKNAANNAIEKNTQVALGFGGRAKITKSTALTGEYYHNFSRMSGGSPFYNALGFGFDIETGGHVFQLVFTNAIGLTERAFITETPDNFFDGDIHFGFNVTRTFQLKKDK